MRISFFGGAETVTGSRYMVDSGGKRVLIDCGLFQGLKPIRSRNWSRFPVDPATLDAVVLTHAHIDHSGFLPALVRDGFRGPIFATRGTADLCDILLPDAAYLQEEDARHANKRRSSKHDPALPLFTSEDARAALDLFVTRPFSESFSPVDGFNVEFSPVGHILGAACVRVSDATTSVLFTGDVGRPRDAVMRAPAPPPPADYVVTESTYGHRRHPADDPLDLLADVVSRTVSRGGSVLIPTFAVGRAQTILHMLATLRSNGRIPVVPTFLNSPMAVDATDLFFAHSESHLLTDEQCREMCEGVTFVREVEDSIELTQRRGPMIVLSASGMATGGRVLHHLVQLAPDPKNSILFAGYQAAGTRGESMLAGAERIKIFGEYIPVRAEVVLIEGLSAHADAAELTEWLRSMPTTPKKAFIVHGEPSSADALRRTLRDDLGWDTEVPFHGETVGIS